MISTYGGVLSAIEEALRELVAEYRGVGKSLQDLVEGQERNTAQLERIGAAMERRWGLEEESGKEENGDVRGWPRRKSGGGDSIIHLLLVTGFVCSLNRIYFFCELNV